jgi:serine/threonine-protein kinase
MNWWEELQTPVIGKYCIERLHGEGGMAQVFVARTVEGVVRQVAVKVPKIDEIAPKLLPQLLRRFRKEIEAQAAEPIPNIAPMLDAGEFKDSNGVSRPFLVMPFLGGGSLGDRLGGVVGQRTNRQTLAEVIEWSLPIARALDALHGSKPPRLHRDVKPDNILFNTSGAAFLSDFGIATTLEDIQTASGYGSLGSGSTLASVGGAPGSPGYQSPESIAGVRTPASDQFSLAIAAYEALSGRLPTRASNRDTYIQELKDWKPIPLSQHCPDLPAAVVDAVMKGMSRDVKDRHSSCTEFAKTLEAAARGKVNTPPASDSKPRSRPFVMPADDAAGRPWVEKKGNRWGLWLGAGGLVVAAAAAAAAFVFLPKSARNPVRPVATMGTLLVSADAPCRLTLDGEAKGDLVAEDLSKRFELGAGEHQVSCTSRERSGISASTTSTIVLGQQVLASVELRERITQAKADEAKRLEDAKVAAEAAERKRVTDAKAAEERDAKRKRDAEVAEKARLEAEKAIAEARERQRIAEADADRARQVAAEAERRRIEDEDRRRKEKESGPDSCEFANDGTCDEPGACDPGTDTTDCRRSRRRPSGQELQPLFCCDVNLIKRCQITVNPSPPGTQCFCPGQGFGVVCR